MRASLLRSARDLSPGAKLIQGDAYHLPFANPSFDCVISVYVFEHLANLPQCLAEVKRVLKPGGALLVGLPAEGGFAYDIARRMTSKRRYESKFNVDYLRLVQSEHCNTCQEVIDELDQWFNIDSVCYLPFGISGVHLNVVAVIHCSNSKNL
jgi:ubiquinone/menaquinone biosynthesis C-methylase UbiE